jgi:hypothetical protein
VAVVLPPPEWRRRRGLRENARNARRATWRAVRYSAIATHRLIASKGREEALLAVGAGIVTFIVLPSDSDLPRLVAAFAVPLGSLFVVSVLIFLGLLLWTPIEDHRKLVWERDDAKEGSDHWHEEARQRLSDIMDRDVRAVAVADQHRMELEAVREDGERQVRTAQMRAALHALENNPPQLESPSYVVDNWLKELNQVLVRAGRTDLARTLFTSAQERTGAARLQHYLQHAREYQREEAR